MTFILLRVRDLKWMIRSALFIALLSTSHDGSSIELSDSSKITLLTCSPGEELYSAFGHNGIRVTDYRQGFDVVFNYGTFDFNQPGFYINFIRGRMRYMLTTDRFEDFLVQYQYEKRSVLEQQLRLNTDDRKKIFAFLYENAKPENREYLYDFFWDNCATRPRDVFEKHLKSRLQVTIDSTCGFEENITMHDMLRLYVGDRKWIDASFDLLLGMPCEVIASPRDQTFLPDYLVKYFNCAKVDGKPFITAATYLLQYPSPVIRIKFHPAYLSILILLSGIALILYEKTKPRKFLLFDVLLFAITGLMGVILLAMWLFTSHYAPPRNMNLLWLLPTHLPIAFLLIKKQRPKWMNFYFLFTSIVQILLLLIWKWSPQPLNIAFMPLIILLALRSLSLFYQSQNQRLTLKE